MVRKTWCARHGAQDMVRKTWCARHGAQDMVRKTWCARPKPAGTSWLNDRHNPGSVRIDAVENPQQGTTQGLDLQCLGMATDWHSSWAWTCPRPNKGRSQRRPKLVPPPGRPKLVPPRPLARPSLSADRGNIDRSSIDRSSIDCGRHPGVHLGLGPTNHGLALFHSPRQCSPVPPGIRPPRQKRPPCRPGAESC
ncbi:MAG: hypothetical protein ACI9VR_002145 [Cognaticolwellia sp.]|jgi:hypothetical protein